MLGKELYFNYRNPGFKQVIDRKNSFLGLFSRPFGFQNGDVRVVIDLIKSKSQSEFPKSSVGGYIFILVHDPNYCLEEDFYAKNAELREHFELLKKLVASVSYKELPGISLAIAFDLNYRVDVFKLWAVVVEQVVRHVHNFSTV